VKHYWSAEKLPELLFAWWSFNEVEKNSLHGGRLLEPPLFNNSSKTKI